VASYIIDCDGTIVWEPTEDDFERIRMEREELLGAIRDDGCA
jgi:hypothetical protein